MRHEEITHEKLYQTIKNNSVEIRNNKVEANTKFDKLFKLYSSLDKRLEFLNSKFSTFDERLEFLNSKFSTFDKRLEFLSSKLTIFDKRMDFISAKFTNFDKRLSRLEEMLAPFPNLMDKVDRLIGEIIENREERVVTTARLENHEKRLTLLEAK